jgi:hypothetical protein
METSGVLWLQTHGHPPEEVLERYSMAYSSSDGVAAGLSVALLSEEEHERVEEHLFLCESCRKQLDECDQWVALMKAAAAPVSHGTTVGSPPFWRRWWRTVNEFGSWPALAGGMAMIVAVLWMAPALFSPGRNGGVSSVSLSAMRGNDLRVRVRAGASLELKIEDDDVAGASVLVVDAAGRQVWSGALEQGNTARVPSLKEGTYWVRLMSAGSGEQIKEYGLSVE